MGPVPDVLPKASGRTTPANPTTGTAKDECKPPGRTGVLMHVHAGTRGMNHASPQAPRKPAFPVPRHEDRPTLRAITVIGVTPTGRNGIYR